MAHVEQFELTVRDGAIHCDGCESRIEKMVRAMPGVMRVNADHQTQRVAVTADADRTSVLDIKQKLEAAGYTSD